MAFQKGNKLGGGKGKKRDTEKSQKSAEFNDECRKHGKELLKVWLEAMREAEIYNKQGDALPDYNVRIRAAEKIAERAFGRPKQEMEIEGLKGDTFTVIIAPHDGNHDEDDGEEEGDDE